MKKKKSYIFLLLHLFLMIYSITGILSKLAGRQPFLSLPFLIIYAAEILILGLYAIGWQQFLKRLPLSFAYSNKAVGIVWSCIWGTLIFHEHLTTGKVIGAVFVLCGVALYGYTDGKSDTGKEAEG